MPDIDTTESPLVFNVYYITNTLSVIGQLFIIITYLGIRKKSNSFYQYVACHTLIEIPWLVSNYLIVTYRKEDSTPCSVSSFINIYSYLAGMFWSAIIAWVIYNSLRTKQKLSSIKWRYAFIVATISLAFILHATIVGDLGPFQGSEISYCWIKNNYSGSIFITYWIPLALTSAFGLYCYVRSVLIVKRTVSKEVSKEFWPLLLFPLIQILCNSGGAIRRISIILGDSYSVHLEILHIICAKGQGLLEALAYGLNVGVRTEIYKLWCKKRRRPASTTATKSGDLEKSLTSFDQNSIESEYMERSGRLVL